MTEEKEIWQDIAGYEGLYKVSNLGRVKSLNYRRTGKEHLLNKTLSKGYWRVLLSKNCISKKFSVHRLVSQAFIENPENLPQVNHIDENKLNNRVENLEWCSAEYNNKYGTRNERVLETKKLRKCKNAEIPVLQFTKDGKFVNEYSSIIEAKRITGIQQGHICYCCKNIKGYNSAGGYIWKYKNND